MEPAKRGFAYVWEQSTHGWVWAPFCGAHAQAALGKGAVAVPWVPDTHEEWREGPVSVELRAMGASPLWFGSQFSRRAYEVWVGAQEELWRQGLHNPGQEDIASAAIEAAEALGL